jgi:hypothetical protein
MSSYGLQRRSKGGLLCITGLIHFMQEQQLRQSRFVNGLANLLTP